MANNLPFIKRLEPSRFQRNVEKGFSASIHDPVWFLARQWQMGEHQGENASSPIWTNYDFVNRPIESADKRFDPKVIPAESIVESELFDWWTMGRRIRIGRKLASHPKVKDNSHLLFTDPPPPYEHFINEIDGFLVWKSRTILNIPTDLFGNDIPEDSIPAWNSKELLYEQTDENAFETEQKKLTVHRHQGGRLDWYSVDGKTANIHIETKTQSEEAIPTPLQYPGAPNSRWWEFENAIVDIGGYVPDSAHTHTALLTDLIFSHSDDWFLFPILAKAGNVIAVEKIIVTDVFGRTYDSTEQDAENKFIYKGLHPPKNWSIFQVSGLDSSDLILWHVAELPLISSPLEKVQFGLDEHSNLLWAVERIIDSRDVQSSIEKEPDNENLKFNAGIPKGNALPGQEIEYAYIPAKGISRYWYPYEIDKSKDIRQLVQRSLVDYSLQQPKKMPLPNAQVLQSIEPEQLHVINPLAIPSNGIQLERRWQLARDMNGLPVLWIQRKRSPLLAPPARLLKFDVMEVANFENEI